VSTEQPWPWPPTLDALQAAPASHRVLLDDDGGRVLAARGVTQREAEVAAQVAAGRSNREIAGKLHLSVRTVESTWNGFS
jgi:DNA-binding NarL/FixJ family response regulator